MVLLYAQVGIVDEVGSGGAVRDVVCASVDVVPEVEGTSEGMSVDTVVGV